MGYFATLWYAGVLILQMGDGSQSLNDCNMMITIMERDIKAAYENPETMSELQQSVFPENRFTYSCETEVLVEGYD